MECAFKANGACRDGAVVKGEKWRFSILTAGLIRLEYDPEGRFEDRPSQKVVNRDFPVPDFYVKEEEECLEIFTKSVHLVYDKRPFSGNGLHIQYRADGMTWTWHYGDGAPNLGGTARTLDGADGAVELEPGVLSRIGLAVFDDSDSVLLTEEGWIAPRRAGCRDLYFFGYGHRYEECLKDFYHLTGPMPLLPRYVLGNWWSRNYRYDAKEYREVIERFEEEKIPVSVAVIDMDWHLVDVDPKYGRGWTGYTWNRDLFPDPKGFLQWLHAHGLRVSLNVHPADGIRAYEEQYPVMAREMGRDAEKEEVVLFDVTDRRFMEAYFKYLHHPMEEDGVDFWWMDWQQGSHTKIPGLDPLWMLNHYHYLDSSRRGNRGLTFSRYAGIGSHRYPIGFSGDTAITWESLDFQPYFTATASNAGFGWWSHDIGGYIGGRKDEELQVRWVEFGVFSPIFRLHCCDGFIHKEPWFYRKENRETMARYMRLRHSMIPYLYTMNVLANREGRALMRPMYYSFPEKEEAYQVPNEYWFGTQLLACPITKPAKKTGLAPVKAWLPEGTWYDIFNGRVYRGDRMMTMYRFLTDIPVLAKAGGILPLDGRSEYTNSVDNPDALAVKIFAGESGAFHLYEDEGDTREDREENWADTHLQFEWGPRSRFIIHAAAGNTAVIPESRSWRLEFYGVKRQEQVTAGWGGQTRSVTAEYDEKRHVLSVQLPSISVASEIEVMIESGTEICGNAVTEQIHELLLWAELEHDLKNAIYKLVQEQEDTAAVLCGLQSMGLKKHVCGMVSEILLAY